MSKTIPPVGTIPVTTEELRLDSRVDPRHIEDLYLKEGAALIVSVPKKGTLVVIDYTTGLPLGDEATVKGPTEIVIYTTTSAPLKNVRVTFRAPPTAGDDSGRPPRPFEIPPPPNCDPVS